MENSVGFVTRVAFGLRLRLLLLVLLACMPLMFLTLHTAWEDRRRAMANWQQRSQRIAQLARREEEKAIGETRQLLVAIAESSPVRMGNQRGCQRLLDHLFATYPRYANLGVIQTNGELLASAMPVRASGDLDCGKLLSRVEATHEFAIGEFSTSNPGSKPTVSFGLPVRDRLGRVQSVVFAVLDFGSFTRFGSELAAQLPRGATFTEIDRRGDLVVRHPPPERRIQQLRWDESIMGTVFSHQLGTLELPSPQGVPSFYAFVVIQSELAADEVAAILGVPKQVLFAEADRLLARNLIWMAIAAASALGLGWFGSQFLVLHPIKTLVNSSTRLASGDLTTRTGLPYSPNELGQLARTFDQMAGALEQREVERQRANLKLQALSRRLVEVQESERRHLARELHDEIGQSLTLAALSLQAALRAPAAKMLAPHLQASAEIVDRVMDQVHDLSLNLRPSMLDDLGLEPAVRWYTNRQATLAGLKSAFHSNVLEARLDPVVETGCFRVAQEALTNVVRHSQARRVAVELRRTDEHLHLSVRDDGTGFDVAAMREQAVSGASLGLLSMEERAILAGGGFELHSEPGKGTEVHAWFPLHSQFATPLPPAKPEAFTA